jgi:glucose/arabinose dehydrogenase
MQEKRLLNDHGHEHGRAPQGPLHHAAKASFAGALLLLVAFAIDTSPAAAYQYLGLELVASGVERPVAIATPDDGSGRLFVAGQWGEVRVIDDGVLLPDPLVDVGDRISCCTGEQGLLGITTAPGFAEARQVYLFYTTADYRIVVSRFAMDGPGANTADGDSEQVILEIQHPLQYQFHWGGQIAFGPDGLLYMATGDGGSPQDSLGNAQNPNSLLGKILRMDVGSGEGPWAPEVFASGLRNPWRFSFDGDLIYIADVGESAWEEVTAVDTGGAGYNLGWPIMEGAHCLGGAQCNQAPYVLPQIEYSHAEGCAVVGGFVYRGALLSGQQGRYFYGDFCTGEIWGAAQGLDAEGNLSTFGQDAAGELYAATVQGDVFRLSPVVPGLLRVETSPALPSRIRVNGVDRDHWGLEWLPLPPGTYTVEFGRVFGHQEPTPQVVQVSSGQVTTVVGTFTRLGVLRVVTEPPVASTIYIDGVPRDDWGVWMEIAPGEHEVCFGDAAGWDVPECQDVMVVGGQQSLVTGAFVANPSAPGPAGPYGFLRVRTQAVADARVFIDGIPRDNWGLDWMKIPPGTYLVSFSGSYGMSPAPPPRFVTVAAGLTTETVGAYTVEGWLHVITSPPVPEPVFVDGLARNRWGTWTNFAAGTYEVCFADIPGWTTPPCQDVPVVAAGLAEVTGVYVPE